MATKKYLSLDRLTEYDGKIKDLISSSDAATLASAKSHAESYADGKLSSLTNGTTVVAKAEEANHATSADTATNANHAASADTATNATNATNAEHAASADTASNAEKLGGQLPSYYAAASDIPTGELADKDVVSASDLDSDLAGKVNAAHSHTNKTVLDGITAEKVSNWESAEADANAYTDQKVSGLASTITVDNKISTHNTSDAAHSDIRDLISELTTKVNNFLDVDDTTTDQLSEVLELINNNKGTLDSLTSGKVNVSDIADDLTTNSATKVLSAKQGVALKALIDALQEEFDKHGHEIADVTGLQAALNNKADASHGTHVEFDSTNNPKMDGTAAFGTSTKVARADHVHPTDTSRASKTEFDSHVGDATHITSEERTKWNTAKTHADSDHAPAEAQENVIESIKVNGNDQTITSKSVNITVPTKASDIGAAPSSHTHAISEITDLQTTLTNASNAIVANTNSITAHTGRIESLEAKVGDGFTEITSAEIQALFA